MKVTSSIHKLTARY